MFTVNVHSNLQQAVDKLRVLSPRQFPFIISLAINSTAKDAQEAVKQSLKGNFTIRNTWTEKGIRFKASNKTNLAATIFTKDYYMERQEFGGDKKNSGGSFNIGPSVSVTTKKGGTYVRPAAPGTVAIPTKNVLTTKRGIIRKRDTPQGLGDKAFVIKAADGRKFLAVRIARGKRAGLQIYYTLRDRSTIKPRLGMKEITKKVVDRRFMKHLDDAISRAMATVDRSRGL